MATPVTIPSSEFKSLSLVPFQLQPQHPLLCASVRPRNRRLDVAVTQSRPLVYPQPLLRHATRLGRPREAPGQCNYAVTRVKLLPGAANSMRSR